MTRACDVTNRMSSWFGARVEVAGKRYVLVRGVNWDEERAYDKNNPGVELLEPFVHTISTRYSYAPSDKMPNRTSVKNEVLARIKTEWPVLSSARIVFSDQDDTGRLGGFPVVNGVTKIDPVTRFVFDFGSRKSLPVVVYKPSENPSFARNPVFWIPEDQVYKLTPPEKTLQGRQLSPCFVPFLGPIVMETKKNGQKGLQVVVAQDIVFQHTVAEAYQLAGVKFQPAPKDYVLSPSLRVVAHRWMPRLVAVSDKVEKTVASTLGPRGDCLVNLVARAKTKVLRHLLPK